MKNASIEAIEKKGYTVVECENMVMGKLDERHPVVYEIEYPDRRNVYGANSVYPEALADWVDLLPALAEPKPAAPAPKWDAEKEAERRKKEREYDNLYNEGGEGYNPYRR